jgi:hypothetical protein
MIRASKTAKTFIKSGTGAETVKSTGGRVFWLAAHTTSNQNVVLMKDGGASGTTKYQTAVPVDTAKFTRFDPPLEFATDIYFQSSIGSPTFTLGYE